MIVDSLKDEFDDMRVQMTHLLGKPMTPDAYFTVDLNMYGVRKNTKE